MVSHDGNSEPGVGNSRRGVQAGSVALGRSALIDPLTLMTRSVRQLRSGKTTK